MPTHLRTEVALYMYHKLVRKIYFFQDKEPGFLSYVIPKLHVLFVKLNDAIYQIYELAEEVYFLMEGRVDLIAPSGICYRAYIQGAYFGEVEILLGKTRNCTVKAAIHTQLLIMSKSDFIKTLEDFPKIAKEVIEVAHSRELVHISDTKRIQFVRKISKFPLLRTKTSIRRRASELANSRHSITPSLTVKVAGSKTKDELKKRKYRNMWQKLIQKNEEEEEKKRVSGKWDMVMRNMFKEKRKSAHSAIVSADISHVSSTNITLLKRWFVRRPRPAPLKADSRWKVVQSRLDRIKKLVSKEKSGVLIAPSPPKHFSKVDWLFENGIEEVLLRREEASAITPRTQLRKITLLTLKAHNFFLDKLMSRMKSQEARITSLHRRIHTAFKMLYKRLELDE